MRVLLFAMFLYFPILLFLLLFMLALNSRKIFLLPLKIILSVVSSFLGSAAQSVRGLPFLLLPGMLLILFRQARLALLTFLSSRLPMRADMKALFKVVITLVLL